MTAEDARRLAKNQKVWVACPLLKGPKVYPIRVSRVNDAPGAEPTIVPTDPAAMHVRCKYAHRTLDAAIRAVADHHARKIADHARQLLEWNAKPNISQDAIVPPLTEPI